MSLSLSTRNFVSLSWWRFVFLSITITFSLAKPHNKEHNNKEIVNTHGTSNSHCDVYKNIDFFSADDQAKRIPSLLYTYPGSGNNWLELLVEHATGIRTGSVYPDNYLIKTSLPGYFHCDRSVSLVLMHTVHHRGKDIEKGIISDLCMGNNITRFDKVVMLYRNPFDAIWSEFQRQTTERNNHTGVIPIAKFNETVWFRKSRMLAHHYGAMVESHYPAIERMYKVSEYMYIRYEDMLQTHLREGILDQLVSFLGLSSSPERIKCAFSLSDSPKVHRRKVAGVMTKDLAYAPKYKSIVCDIWRIVSTARGYSKFNYTMPLAWDSVSCRENAH